MRQIDARPDLSPLVEMHMPVPEPRQHESPVQIDDLRRAAGIVDTAHRSNAIARNHDVLQRGARRKTPPAKKGGGHQSTSLAKNVGSRVLGDSVRRAHTSHRRMRFGHGFGWVRSLM